MIYFAVIASVLFGIAGLAMDAGRMYFKKRILQAAADSGAIAGAMEVNRGVTQYVDHLGGVRRQIERRSGE